MGRHLVDYRQLYHPDHDRKILWILQRKNASTSILELMKCRSMIMVEETLPFRDYYTITIVRHPWARVTSGMYNPYGHGPRTFAQKVQEEILDRETPRDIDPHLWPQWVALEGFRVDRWLHFERLDDDWKALQADFDLPDMVRMNVGDGHQWRDQDFDWNLLLPLYEPDFAFCEDWERE